jgi:hypothetical protein
MDYVQIYIVVREVYFVCYCWPYERYTYVQHSTIGKRAKERAISCTLEIFFSNKEYPALGTLQECLQPNRDTHSTLGCHQQFATDSRDQLFPNRD